MSAALSLEACDMVILFAQAKATFLTLTDIAWMQHATNLGRNRCIFQQMMKFYILKMCGLIDHGYRKESRLLVWRIPMGCDGGNT